MIGKLTVPVSAAVVGLLLESDVAVSAVKLNLRTETVNWSKQIDWVKVKGLWGVEGDIKSRYARRSNPPSVVETASDGTSVTSESVSSPSSAPSSVAASPSASTTMKLGVGIPNPTSSSPTVSGESTSPSPSASSVEVDGDSTSSKEMLPLSDSKADGETTATHFDAVIREAALRQKIKSGNYERNDIDEIAVLMAGEHVLTYAKSLSRGTFDKYVIGEIKTRENLEQRINDGDARAKRPLENRNHTFLVMLHLAASATSE